MLDPISILGIGGAGVLVVGAAYPDKKVSHPVKSIKNWLFAVGGLVRLSFSFPKNKDYCKIYGVAYYRA